MSLWKSLITYFFAFLVAAGLVAAPAHAAPAWAQAVGAVCTPPFFKQDERLGPKNLPVPPDPVGKMLVGYSRFGALTADQFLEKHWDEGRKQWIYPSNDGFLGTPREETLAVGTVIDRFGGESGRFLAPADTPFAQRALPPQSLNSCSYDNTGVRKNSYYRYRVVVAFPVLGGTTAGAFEQLGGGLQYKVVTPVGSEPRNVDWLVRRGYLARLN